MCLGFTNHSQMVEILRKCIITTKEPSPIQCGRILHSSSMSFLPVYVNHPLAHSLAHYMIASLKRTIQMVPSWYRTGSQPARGIFCTWPLYAFSSQSHRPSNLYYALRLG